jgi:Spy/CpxP family protein refolding chaperone
MRKRYFIAGSLLVIGMVAIVQAQPGIGFGFGGGPSSLVTNKAVQEDLKLTEEQINKLKDWSKDFRAKREEIYKDKGIDLKDFKAGFTEEGKAKRAEANALVNKEAYKQLGDILKKEQIERLKQIERQQLGVNAFTNAEVVELLKLSDSQKTTVKGVTSDFNKERQDVFAEAFKDKKGFGKVDPEVTKKVAKLEKEAVSKIVDVLDEKQKKTWKELLGAEFDLTKLQFGGFGKDKKKD